MEDEKIDQTYGYSPEDVQEEEGTDRGAAGGAGNLSAMARRNKAAQQSGGGGGGRVKFGLKRASLKSTSAPKSAPIRDTTVDAFDKQFTADSLEFDESGLARQALEERERQSIEDLRKRAGSKKARDIPDM